MLPNDILADIIPVIQHWGPLRAIVRGEAGAVSELFIQAQDLMLLGEQLKIENEYFHLHIDWSCISGAWLLRRGEQMCGIYFLDKHNETVFRLFLLRKDKIFDVNARQRFEQLWQDVSLAGQREKAANE